MIGDRNEQYLQCTCTIKYKIYTSGSGGIVVYTDSLIGGENIIWQSGSQVPKLSF